MTYRVLCTDGLSIPGVEELKRNGNIEAELRPKLSHEELLECIEPFDGLIVRSASKVSRDVFERGKRLKIVARAGVGTDNIDIDAATERGILVVNAPAGNTIATTELAFTMILSLARQVPQASRLMAEGVWEKKRFKGRELARKTLGVVGMGRIGREVAKRALAFDMKVTGFDPYLPDELFDSMGVRRASLEDLLKESDYVTIHSPLTKETENLISAREIAMMKPGACIVNCARGGIVNEEALASALREGKIAGAALDVFTKEPFEGDTFKGIDNVILTPHLGASTSEAQDAVAVEAASAVAQYLTEGMGPNAINLAGADGSTWQKFKGHISLAEKLGALTYQLAGGRVKKVSLLSGSGLPRLIVVSAVKGAFSGASDGQVTFVNAEKVAKDHGIAVAEEIVGDDIDFPGAIGVRLSSDKGDTEAWGAVLPDGTMKIVRVGDYRVEINPAGSILFIHNLDRPGVIGRVTTLLGSDGVNIAEMQNVRLKQGENALTVIGIDGTAGPETLKRLADEEGVAGVSLVRL